MGLADIENLLKAAMGLNAASIGAATIARAVDQRIAACKLQDLRTYWACVQQSQAELQNLIEAVVVPETWFFRDPKSFAALARLLSEEWQAGPADRVLSVLSLPCSTGEEPYSLAMALLDAAIPAGRFRVDAVDISARALAWAGRAVYGKNSFRGQDLAFRDRHFEHTAEGHRVNEVVRRQVHFQPGNLFATDLLPGAGLYDAIFCRNVLIYFDRDTQDRAIRVITRLLKINALLFVAPAETGLPSSHGFASVNLPLAFGFRRTQTAGGALVASAPAVRRRVELGAAPGPPAAVRSPLPPPSLQGPRRQVASSTPTLAMSEIAELADRGHFDKAAACCVDHLRVHGPSAAAFYLMGLVRDAGGHHQEAGRYYRKALYLQPDHREAQVHLALLLEQQGDAAGASVLRKRASRLGNRIT
jgi:chemotaxis protein methyltransferase WspC